MKIAAFYENIAEGARASGVSMEKAGYVQLQEGIVSLKDAGFNGRNQEVKIAGIVYSFTDEGRELLLRNISEKLQLDESLYVGTSSVKSVDVLTHNQSDKFKYKCVFNKKFTAAGSALTGRGQVLEFLAKTQN